MATEFQRKVLAEIRRQYTGARYPNPVGTLMRGGKLTPTARRLGAFSTSDVKSLERRVHIAIKRLQESGQVAFVLRFETIWVAESGFLDAEVVDSPFRGERPHDWDDL